MPKTRAPEAARSSAVARPIPVAAPVTRIALSLSEGRGSLTPPSPTTATAVFVGLRVGDDAEHGLLGRLGFGELADDAAVGDDEAAVGDADHLFELGGDDDEPDTLPGEIDDQSIDLVAGADIDALGGFVEEQDARCPHEHAGKEELLLVAAGKMRDRGRRRARLDLQLAHRAERGVLLLVGADDAARGKQIEVADGDVAADGKIEQEA